MDCRGLCRQAICTGTVLLTLVCGYARADDICSLTFKGEASGGSLILGRTRFYGPSYVSVETLPGESADSVARRLADQIMANHADKGLSDLHKLWLGSGRPASGATVELAEPRGSYFLAGTEAGLEIPRPPVFLTAVYEEKRGTVELKWENPPGGYDGLVISLEWGRGRHSARKQVPGDTTSFPIDGIGVAVDVNDLCAAVVGVRGGIMSGAGAIHISKNYQDEAFTIPFAEGIMPNWRPWGTGKGQLAETLLAMGRHDAIIRAYVPEDGLDAKPFFQVMRANPTGTVGVYRKFLGLTPGHTYRIAGAISTLKMQAGRGNWALSFSASPHGSDSRDLTPEQLAGRSPLPSGKTGPRAGQVAAFGQGMRMTGQGFRLIRSRPRRQGVDEEGMDVTLPPGVDTLTVWVRLECSDPNGEVGFMGVGIEDMTSKRSQTGPRG